MAKFLDALGLNVLWSKVTNRINSEIKEKVLDRRNKPDGFVMINLQGKMEPQFLPALKTINGTSLIGEGDINLNTELYKIVTKLPDPNNIQEAATIDPNKIYLIRQPSTENPEKDNFVEYIFVTFPDDQEEIGSWEYIGIMKPDVDLSNYVDKDFLNGKLEAYVRGDVLENLLAQYVTSTNLTNILTNYVSASNALTTAEINEICV